ncbi:MAG: NAD(+)/NADH kinase [Desulfofustis sp. PB-SRB1]|nr:NAD(+)/NADH kinase [Desulfofustis sp. PB-SRB1]
MITDAAAHATPDGLAVRAGIQCLANAIEADLDILIILGGDGTLLRIAETAARLSIPVIGINLGNLGFLTELTKDESTRHPGRHPCRHSQYGTSLAALNQAQKRLILEFTAICPQRRGNQ